MKTLTTLLICLTMFTFEVAAQDPAFRADLQRLSSQLQAMGSEYHSKAEWRAVVGELDSLVARASQPSEMVEVNLLQAMVAGDMLKDYAACRDILEATRQRHADLDAPVMRRVYSKLAEAYSQLGDEAAVDALIKAYEASPAYDEDTYIFRGGEGPGDPILVQRPRAPAHDSITRTAMETQRRRARLTAGGMLPDFQSTDQHGAAIRLSDFRGKVVLVDFWVRGWYPWEQQLPYLVSTYERYRDQGFEVVGICMDRDTAGLQDYLNRHGMRWRNVVKDASLPGKYGVYGEATNYLVDRQGVVVGRDLAGSELVEAIKAAL